MGKINSGEKMDRIKVLLVEDQDLLLDGMSLSLESSGEIEVVGKLKDIADYFSFDNKATLMSFSPMCAVQTITTALILSKKSKKTILELKLL